MDRLQHNTANMNLSTPRLGGGLSPSEVLLTHSETPHKQNMSSTNVFINGTLEEQRKAVQEDLGPIPEVSVEFMLEYLIPKSNVNVEATLTKLKNECIWTEDYRWRSFNGQSPYEMSTDRKKLPNNPDTSTETKIFKNLKEIYDSIISCAQFHDQTPSRKPTLTFKQNPDLAPMSNTDIRSRPDGYGVLTEDQEIHSERVVRYSEQDPAYNSKPTGTNLTLKIPTAVNWFDIACVEEYKIHTSERDRNDNVYKMIWSLHHIMHVDHRRRFCFGITIEDENTRIWFACRQIVVVSEPFNFSKNPLQLIRLIASLAFATTTQLGYDPTMKLHWGEDDYCYDIECFFDKKDGSTGIQLYRTQSVIFDSAYNLRGRATRVYLARALRHHGNRSHLGPHYVLKDSWIDINRAKEGDTLQKLLEGASDTEKELFLTVHQHGVVQIDNQDDCTEALILKGRKIEFQDHQKRSESPSDIQQDDIQQDDIQQDDIQQDDAFNPYVDKSENNDLSQNPGTVEEDQRESAEKAEIFYLFVPEGRPRSTTQTGEASARRPKGAKDALRHNTHHLKKKPIVYSPKVHYRIVFTETGKSLKDMADDGEITTRILIQFMTDITNALKYLAKKGYVHRDVSIANIIWHQGHAKLADFEFAKPYSTGASSLVRTGTYHFMSGEVMAQKYSGTKYIDQNSSITFVYNPIHDLESLWWVGSYCIFWHYPAPFTKFLPFQHKDDSTSNPRVKYKYRKFNKVERKHMDRVQEDAHELFPSIYTTADFEYRMEEIHNRRRFSLRATARGPYPPAMHAINNSLNNIRHCISLAHHEIQRSLPRTEASYFTDVLRVANPSDTIIPLDPSVEILGTGKESIYEMVLQMLASVEKKNQLEDAILWPLGVQSQENYMAFLDGQESREKLRPRPLPHESIKIDAEEDFDEY